MKINILKTIIALVLVIPIVACEKDDDSAQQQQQSTVNHLVPSSLAGSVINMEFTFANPGAPYQLGDKATFTFSSSGKMFVDIDPAAANGDEIETSDLSSVGSELVWKDAANGFNYALSFKPDSTVNEINVSNLANAFLGQFTPI